MTDITPSQIEATYELIGPRIRKTPILMLDGADFGLTSPLALKLEFTQMSGSFKVRGAFANVLLRDVPPAGVVAASGGNHGAAVAYAAAKVGCRAHIFVPTVASPAKVDRIRSYGAKLTVIGDRYADALAASEEWSRTNDAMQVHAYNQRETILGQGTIALELSQQVPALDTVLVAVGGGGLIGGVASWFQGRTTVIGVEPTLAPTLDYAFKAGKPVDAPAGGVAADSLAPRSIGEMAFSIAQKYVDRVVLVEDDDIVRAQAMLWESTRIVTEPGGATALAALLSRAYVPHPGERIAVILCGGNTTKLPE